MLDSVFASLQANLANLSEWWQSINTTYRAGGCMLLAIFLMWEATKAHEENDRMFFVSGLVALGLLGYGAVLFFEGTSIAR